MFGEISYGVAFIAGLMSFFSPCVLPMIPAYILYISGSSVGEEQASRMKMFSRTLAFVFGFTIVFIIMGASASAIGKVFDQYQGAIQKISGTLIIFFGLTQLGIIKLSALQKVSKIKRMPKGDSYLGALLLGIAFAAGWSPCFGAVLAGILAYAGTSDTITKGVSLLLTYSVGMGIPFLVTAFFISEITPYFAKAEKHANKIKKAAGIVLIIFGFLIITGQLVKISGFLLSL